MTKPTMLIGLLLAACSGSASTTSTTPSIPAADHEPGSGDDKRLPPDEYPGRKLQLLRTPAELSWQAAPAAPGVSTAGAWGDPSKEGGWFIKLAEGSATQQTYAVDARAVIVEGTVKPIEKHSPNTRIGALTPGSAWFQPANTPRTIECASGECVVFVETTGTTGGTQAPDKRVYALAWAPLDASNASSPQTATLWGDSKTAASGVLIKLPAGNATFWHIHRFDYHGVVIAGTVDNLESGKQSKELPPGSYWMQPGGNKHTTNCKAGGPECLVYAHFMGAFDVKAM
jgi:quercetin dioxygenase-like cupin family protein